MKKYLLFLLLPLFIFTCSDDETASGGEIIEEPVPEINTEIAPENGICESSELQIISDGEDCEVDSSFWICRVEKIKETQFVDKDAYDWSPDICSFVVNDFITFRHESETTNFRVVGMHHFVAEERIYQDCFDNIERATFICQKNEVMRVFFLNDLLGPDTLGLELRTMALIYQQDGDPVKRNIINFFQDRNFSNIRNFWIRYAIGDGYLDGPWQSEYQSLVLNGVTYSDVIEYRIPSGAAVNPNANYYFQKNLGILGFEKNGKLWIRE